MQRLKPWIIAVIAASLTLSVVAGASAQSTPPTAFTGTVTGPEGVVAADLAVESFVGDREESCNNAPTTTFQRIENNQVVTKYFVAVTHASQKPGCGSDGAEVRFTIGGRAVVQTGTWGTSALQTLNLTLAPEGPDTATVHVAVWRSTSNPADLYLSTRPEGGSWTTHDDDGPLSMSEFGTGRFERSDDLIAVDIDLGNGATATVHVAVWRSTSNPTSLYLSTRPEGGTWTTHDDDGPLSMSEFGTGRFERSDDLIAVDVVLE